MRFPPNHGSVGVDLFSTNPYPPPPHPHSLPPPSSTAHEHAYGADPYAYPAAVRRIDFGAPLDGAAAGASTSTIHLPPPQGGVAAFGRANAGSPAPGAGALYALDGGESDDERRDGGGGGDAHGHVLQIRHSDSFELDERERLHLGGGGGGGGLGGAAPAQGTPRIFVGGGEGDEESPEVWGAQDDEEGGGMGGAGQQQVGGGDQTGVILGCVGSLSVSLSLSWSASLD